MDALQSIFDILRAFLINIPLNNPLSVLYVILNILALLFAGFTRM
jgi:hypothetical protein